MEKKHGNFLMFLGLLLIVAAFFWTAWNLMTDRQAGIVSGRTLEKLWGIIPETSTDPASPPEMSEDPSVLPGEMEIPDYILNPDMDMPTRNIDGLDYIGVLSIPVISLELPVAADWSYNALRIAPCRYAGSAYADDLVIAGHNYKTLFSSLHSLQPDDELTFTDVDGNVFRYRVALTEILDESAVAEMTESGFALTLFSCTVGGQYRVTVRCDKIARKT